MTKPSDQTQSKPRARRRQPRKRPLRTEEQKQRARVAPVNGEGTQDSTPGEFTTELRNTQRSAKALIGLVDHDTVKDMQGGEDVLAALEQFAEARIPTAQALARAAFAGAIDNQGIYILWSRARRAFMAAAPAIMDMFLEKMQKGYACDYSERLLVAAMKGTGMLVPSEPVADSDRERMLTEEEVKSLTDDELRTRLQQQNMEGE